MEAITNSFEKKCRSITNLLSAARREHVEKCHDCTPQLAQTYADCLRTGRKRLILPKRANALSSLLLATSTSTGNSYQTLRMPLHQHCITLSSQTMLRLYGAGHLRKCNVVIRTDLKKVTCHISNPKQMQVRKASEIVVIALALHLMLFQIVTS